MNAAPSPSESQTAELTPAALCAATQEALKAFVDVMNRETILLRSGKLEEAGELSAEKAKRGQDYVVLARRVQHNASSIKNEVPEAIDALRQGQEVLATQMAENLKVLASARSLTEQLLNDVANRVGQSQRAGSYSPSGSAPAASNGGMKGLSVNRAL